MGIESNEIRWKQRFANYKKAFKFLKQGLGISQPTPIEIAGITQAFEFTFELAWKTLKDFLKAKGEGVNFPRDVLKKAFEYGLIEEGDIWMDMLEKRNLISHTYEETKANLAYQLIKKEYFKPLNSFYECFLKMQGNE